MGSTVYFGAWTLYLFKMKLFKRNKKTKDVISEGVGAKETFQRVFFSVFEDIKKYPPISEIFLSNIVRRVFSHNVFQTMDGKKASFFKETIDTGRVSYQVSETKDTVIIINSDLLKRSRKIGLEVDNSAITSDCDVHIQPQGIVGGTNANNDLYTFLATRNSASAFQFTCSFTRCKIILRQQTYASEIIIKISYQPL